LNHVFLPSPDPLPLRGQQRHATPDHLIDDEEIKLLAQFSMVSLGGLFAAFQVLIELSLARKGRAVDPCQLLILFAPLPVGARDRQQLEGSQLSRVRNMRSQAKVDKVA